MRRRALSLTVVLLLTGTAVAYGVADSGSGASDHFPLTPPEPPPAVEHFRGGEPIVLESDSPAAEAPALKRPEEEEEKEEELDKPLHPKHFEANSRRAVVPNTTGDDARSCHIATAAKARVERGAASRAEFRSEIERAKRESTSAIMRDALDQALAGAPLPPCPPLGRP